MFKRPKIWLLLIALLGLLALTLHIGRTQVAAPSSLKSSVEAPRAEPKEGGPQQEPPAAEAKHQPPADKYEKDCPDPQKRSECVIQLRTAEATEAQARYTMYSLYLVGATIALTLGTVVAGFLTLSTMRDTARKQLRAYVFVKPGNFAFTGRIPKTLYFTVTNHGETPAYRMILFTSLLFLPHPLPDGFNLGPPDDGSGDTTNVLAPGDIRPGKRDLGKPITPTMENQLRAGTHRYYIFVLVRYRDAFRSWFFFRRTRTTRMCASVSGEQLIAGMYAPTGTEMDLQWDFDERFNDAD